MDDQLWYGASRKCTHNDKHMHVYATDAFVRTTHATAVISFPLPSTSSGAWLGAGAGAGAAGLPPFVGYLRCVGAERIDRRTALRQHLMKISAGVGHFWLGARVDCNRWTHVR